MLDNSELLKDFPKDRFFTREHVENCLNAIRGKTLGEIDSLGAGYIPTAMEVNKTKVQKGIAGDIIQKALGCGRDSYKKPDIVVDGIMTELKTTGVKSSKRLGILCPKENITITDVSPASIVLETFETSAFYHKIEHLLFVFYHYTITRAKCTADYAQFPVLGHLFSDIQGESLEKLKNDWSIVQEFLKEHTFDEVDERHKMKRNLMVLDYSSPLQPRFRLKKPFANTLFDEYLNGTHLESLPHSVNKFSDIDDRCHLFTRTYKNCSIDEISKRLCLSFKNEKGQYDKDTVQRIIIKLFGSDAHSINQIKEFSEIGLTAKTIILNSEGKRTEDMKLFPVSFEEWCKDDAVYMSQSDEIESSEMYSYFADNSFVFIVFQEPRKPKNGEKIPLGECRLLGFKRYSFEESFIEKDVKQTWEETRNLVINRTLQEEEKGRGLAPNFPKSKDHIVFLRGSGSTSADRKPRLSDWGIDIKMYIQYVWIQGKYIVDELSRHEYL